MNHCKRHKTLAVPGYSNAPHVGKFIPDKHHWMKPFTRIAALTENSDVQLVHPIVGVPVKLNRDSEQTFEHW